MKRIKKMGVLAGATILICGCAMMMSILTGWIAVESEVLETLTIIVERTPSIMRISLYLGFIIVLAICSLITTVVLLMKVTED